MTELPTMHVSTPNPPAQDRPSTPAAADAVIDGVNVEHVAAAVAACAGVAGLHGGRLGEASSLLPGRRVPGVVVRDGVVTVQVRSKWGVPAVDLLTQIRAATAPLTGGLGLQVMVADIDDPPVSGPSEPPAVLAPVALPAVPDRTLPSSAL